jgi:phosphoribosylanthranilate isomerase
MGPTRVKICGITRPEDAQTASEAGADAVGIIFHRSARRFVEAAQARIIAQAAGPFVTVVGVFVDASLRQIVRTARQVGLGTVQLNGDEPPELVARLAEQGLRAIKALRVDQDLPRQIERWRQADPLPSGLVLETGGTSLPGGSGVANDWQAIRRHQQAGLFDGLPPLILAGGLRPENVARVVRELRPWAVDVSSGVEETTGVKSARLIAEFIQQARSAGA